MVLWVSLLQIKFITQFNLKAVKMNEKHVSLAGYICNAISCLQVMKKEDLFGFCERKFKWMTKDDFEKGTTFFDIARANLESLMTGMQCKKIK